MSGQDNTAVENEPDDGFTTEERAQFESMRSEAPPVDAGPAEPDGGDVAQAEDVAAAQPGDGEAGKPAVETGEGEDDDDDTASGGVAAGADGQAKPPRRVAYNKYKRVEDEAASARKEAQEAREKLARFEERMAIINEAIGAQAPKQEGEDEDKAPNPEEDIFGYVALLGRQIEKANNRISEMASAEQERRQYDAVLNAFGNDVQTFVQKEPTFVDAYNFLMQNRVTELAHYYFEKDITKEGEGLTPEEFQQIKQVIGAEERELVSNALGQKKSPAARIFGLARLRGFQPKAPEPEPKSNGAAKPNGAAKAAPGSLASAAETVTEELQRVQRGVDASTSLSQGGGAPPPNKLTARELADMDQDEFNEMVERLSPSELARLMGGAAA